MSDPSATGRRSRRKGASFERESANMMRALGLEARRNVQARFGGGDGADIETDLPVHFECKVGASPNLWAAMEQAERDSGTSGREPVVLARRNRAAKRRRLDVMVLRLPFALQLLALWARRYDPKLRIVHKRGASPMAWSAFGAADVDHRALPVVVLQREGQNGGDGRERDLVLLPLAEGLKLLVAWAEDGDEAPHTNEQALLDCPCGHPLHPCDGHCDGDPIWHETSQPMKCPACGQRSVVHVIEGEYAFAGYSHPHECRCDPAGEHSCPSMDRED